jgi:hypothetical protein
MTLSSGQAPAGAHIPTLVQCAGELPVRVACRSQFLGSLFELGSEIGLGLFEAGEYGG